MTTLQQFAQSFELKAVSMPRLIQTQTAPISQFSTGAVPACCMQSVCQLGDVDMAFKRQPLTASTRRFCGDTGAIAFESLGM